MAEAAEIVGENMVDAVLSLMNDGPMDEVLRALVVDPKTPATTATGSP
jgi:hypothetical protein